MLKQTFVVLLAFGLLSPALSASAQPNSNARFELPHTATKITDNLYYLGTAKDKKTGQDVEGYAFIHKKGNDARGGGARPKPGSVACYGFLADGAKWKSVEPWVMNTANSEGLDESAVFALMDEGVGTWEDAAEGVLGNSLAMNILGGGSTTSLPLVADEVSPDNVNEVYFGSIGDSNTIGVTIVWGIFGGPKFNRQLMEWDMIFNETDFDWSLSGDLSKMDFGNIAVHELGHAVGLGDIYQSACSAVTMYGYAGEGETNKRTLEADDVKGVSTLY